MFRIREGDQARALYTEGWGSVLTGGARHEFEGAKYIVLNPRDWVRQGHCAQRQGVRCNCKGLGMRIGSPST